MENNLLTQALAKFFLGVIILGFLYSYQHGHCIIGRAGC